LAWQDVAVHPVAGRALTPTTRAVTRRGLLRGFAAAAGLATVGLTAGCDLLGGTPTPPPVTVPAELEALLQQTSALAEAYDAAITRAPSLAAILTGPRDAHREHIAVLAEALGLATPSPASPPAGGPTDPGGTLAALVQAETEGRDSARAACLTAPARIAPLVGSIAAARACHLEVLQ
jgi:hypothetical protein